MNSILKNNSIKSDGKALKRVKASKALRINVKSSCVCI